MEIIGSTQSKFQHIMVCRKGTSVELVLDGRPQTRLPNNAYYELLLGDVTEKDSVLILGGGDLTCVDVLHRKGVSAWDLVEIDNEVIDTCAPFCPHRRDIWGDNVHVGDAFEFIKTCGRYDHVVVDLISITEFDTLSTDITLEKFIQELSRIAVKSVSGYIESKNVGTAAGIVLLPALARVGFKPYLLINDLEENFFFGVKGDHTLPVSPQHHKFIVNYGASVRDERVFDLKLSEQMIIVSEGG